MTGDGQVDVAIAGIDTPHWPVAFADALASVPDASLVGFTDLGVDPESVASNLGTDPETYAAERGLDDLGDLDGAIDAADALLVGTRNTRMPDVLVDAVEAGRDVYAAKPIGVDPDALTAVREAAADADVVLTGGQSGRADPAMAAVLDVVDSGRVGEVRTMRVMHQHGRTHEWTAGTWYTDPSEGGPTTWLGWYPLDVATAVLGPVSDLWGHAQQLVTAADPQPDHLKATARHGDGRLSTLEVYCDVAMDWDVAMLEVEVVGSDGVVRYSSPGEAVRVHQDGGVSEVPFEGGESLGPDLERFVAACRDEGEPVIDTETALHVAAAACAWNAASEAPDRHAAVDARLA